MIPPCCFNPRFTAHDLPSHCLCPNCIHATGPTRFLTFDLLQPSLSIYGYNPSVCRRMHHIQQLPPTDYPREPMLPSANLDLRMSNIQLHQRSISNFAPIRPLGAVAHSAVILAGSTNHSISSRGLHNKVLDATLGHVGMRTLGPIALLLASPSVRAGAFCADKNPRSAVYSASAFSFVINCLRA
jgi:hypothetical protein